MSWDRWEPELPSPTEDWEARRERRHRERLDSEIIETTHEIDRLGARLESERRRVAELNELQARKRALLDELHAIDRQRAVAAKETKDIERQLTIQQQRSERQADRIEWPRHGRPVRIDVDDGAWETIRLAAIEQRTSLRLYVGELVTAEAALREATPGLVPPSSRRRRSSGEGPPLPRRRFLRVHVDDDAWTTIRLAATNTGLTTSRFLGESVEARARALAWRPPMEAGGPRPD